eukprot:2301698-Rhodomonas_salina.1
MVAYVLSAMRVWWRMYVVRCGYGGVCAQRDAGMVAYVRSAMRCDAGMVAYVRSAMRVWCALTMRVCISLCYPGAGSRLTD